MSANKPNPGSDEAVAEGCTCPVLDNGHGRGYLGQRNIFVFTDDCPVHVIARCPICREEVGTSDFCEWCKGWRDGGGRQRTEDRGRKTEEKPKD